MNAYRFNDEGARHFCERVPSGSKILVSEPFDIPFFTNAGLAAEGFDASEQKLGFFQASRESYDGIWADRSLFHIAPNLCLRTIQVFFSALKPKGILFVSFLEHEQYTLEEYESMLRQCGFEPILEGRNEGNPEQIAILARRI